MRKDTLEPDDEHGIVGVMMTSIGEILALRESGKFLRWMHDEGPRHFPDVFGAVPPASRRSFAAGLARAIWNATPLPWNGFRPEKLPAPGRNAPCICGSGLKFKRCCSSAPPLELPEGLVTVMLGDYLPASQLGDFGRALGASDPEILGQVAAHFYDQNQPARTVKLVEPWLERLKKLDDRFEHAFDFLWDAYGDLGQKVKKEKALTLVSRAPEGTARAFAWRRWVTIAADQGDWERAWDYFNRAYRDDPDHPSLALVELTLLSAEVRGEELKLRADFWARRFRALGYPPDLPVFDVLDRSAEDPIEAAFAGWSAAKPEHSRALYRLAKLASQRPLPAYRAVPVKKSRAKARPTKLRLEAPEEIRLLESEWGRVTLGEDGFWKDYPWEPEFAQQWLGFLKEHPASFDSLKILEYLAEAVNGFDISALGIEGLLRPLTERGVAIAEEVLAQHEGAHLPLDAPGNREVLSLFILQRTVEERVGNEDAADLVRQRIVELDPEDQTGVHCELINRFLQTAQDQRALELADRIPGGPEPESAYGKALALFRLGHREEADEALQEAYELVPEVAEALHPGRIKKPDDFNPHLPIISSDVLAWIYRDFMRETWKATPGALAWVKKTVLNARQEKKSGG